MKKLLALTLITGFMSIDTPAQAATPMHEYTIENIGDQIVEVTLFEFDSYLKSGKGNAEVIGKKMIMPLQKATFTTNQCLFPRIFVSLPYSRIKYERNGANPKLQGITFAAEVKMPDIKQGIQQALSGGKTIYGILSATEAVPGLGEVIALLKIGAWFLKEGLTVLKHAFESQATKFKEDWKPIMCVEKLDMQLLQSYKNDPEQAKLHRYPYIGRNIPPKYVWEPTLVKKAEK